MIKNLVPNKSLQTTGKSVLLEDAIEDKEDIVSLTTAFFKNLLGQVPGLNIFTGTAADYYDARVTKRREKELKSFLTAINNRLAGVEMKQEAVEYFEESLVFKLEQINEKLISEPGKGFDEVLSKHVKISFTC